MWPSRRSRGSSPASTSPPPANRTRCAHSDACAARIDKGLEVLRSELDRDRDTVLILSGGQGPDEVAPEGEVMAEYAVDHAEVPAVRDLAQAIARAQSAETRTMATMLAARGGTPLPAP